MQHDLRSEQELERQALCNSHREEVESLKRELAVRETRLTEAVSELARAGAALEERGRGLGKVEGDLERLKEEGRALVEKERAAQRELQQLKVPIIAQDMYGYQQLSKFYLLQATIII